ncbi:MAG: hypothetical protein ABFC96_03300 [Thermoguttaceae bacterium]
MLVLAVVAAGLAAGPLLTAFGQSPADDRPTHEDLGPAGPPEGGPPEPPRDGFGGPPGGERQPGFGPRGPGENLAAIKNSNPELYKLIKKENDLDRRISAAAKKYRGASKDQQQKIKQEIRKLAAEQFEIGQHRRSLELKHREKAKQQIIEQRVSQAIRPMDGRRGPRGPMGPDGGEEGMPPMGPPGGDRRPPE